MQMSLWNATSLRDQLRTLVRGRNNGVDLAPHGSAVKPVSPCTAIAGGTGGAFLSGSTPRTVRPLRPLRVMRVQEAGQPGAAAGRMVISGRIADVCAELDRLAACEALIH